MIMRVRSRSLTKILSGHTNECSWLLDSQRSLFVPTQVVRFGYPFNFKYNPLLVQLR